MNISDFAAAKVLVVGDVMLDSYWHGPVSRISPEAPVPVVCVEKEDVRLGGAGNVALNVAALGANSHFVGLVGSDTTADTLVHLLKEQQIHYHLQRVDGRKTITKLRIISRHQQLIRLDFEEPYDHWDTHSLERAYLEWLNTVDTVILSDYAKGTLNQADVYIRAARAVHKPIIVDPKGTDFTRYRGATLITPNFAEFEAVVGHCPTDETLIERGSVLREQLDLEAILITRSEKGMTLIAKDHPPLELPTRAQEVYDVTGAGDTVVATLGVAIAAGYSLPDAVVLANLAAGIVVSKLGTATVTPQELMQAEMLDRGMVLEPDAAYSGMVDEDGLLQLMTLARARGERIVMTNGCFDLLHPGHIAYLEKARALGDRLVVAVNDDASVRRLKGENRPINSLAVRMHMLNALRCVDWVLSFSEDTPARLYAKVLPDILVKGGDYAEEQVVGGDAVKAAGGSVKIIEFVDGHSTTDLIHRIREGIE